MQLIQLTTSHFLSYSNKQYKSFYNHAPSCPIFALCVKVLNIVFHLSAKTNIPTQKHGLWYQFTDTWTPNTIWYWSLLCSSLSFPAASSEVSQCSEAFWAPGNPEVCLVRNLPFSSFFPWISRLHKAPIPDSYLGFHDGRVRLCFVTPQHKLQCIKLNITKYK